MESTNHVEFMFVFFPAVIGFFLNIAYVFRNKFQRRSSVRILAAFACLFISVLSYMQLADATAMEEVVREELEHFGFILFICAVSAGAIIDL